MSTNERILVLRVRLRGTTASSRTDWTISAVRYIQELFVLTADNLAASTGWTASVESIEVEP